MAISCQKRSLCVDMFPMFSVFCMCFSRLFDDVFNLFYCPCLLMRLVFVTAKTIQHNNKQHTQTQTHTNNNNNNNKQKKVRSLLISIDFIFLIFVSFLFPAKIKLFVPAHPARIKLIKLSGLADTKIKKF